MYYKIVQFFKETLSRRVPANQSVCYLFTLSLFSSRDSIVDSNLKFRFLLSKSMKFLNNARMQPICEVCGVEFSTKTNLNKHLKKFHNIIYVATKNTAGYNKCALCEYENTPEELRKHYQSIHFLELEEKTFSFSGETSFNVSTNYVCLFIEDMTLRYLLTEMINSL